MNRINIITFHRAHNYGAMLQAYALQKKLLDYGYDVSFLDYRNEKIESAYRPINLKNNNVKQKIRSIVKYSIYHNKLNKRYNNFNNFLKKYMNLTNSYYNRDEIEQNINENDIYITGSDQVWNKKIVGELSDIYTLNFDKKIKKRISYGASVGQDSFITENEKEYIEKLSKINCISVREENTKNVLQNIMINKEISVVLDPTLLLSVDIWNKLIDNIECNHSEKYICAYVVVPDEEYIKIVNDLSEKTGLRVIHFGLNNPGYKNVWKSAYTDGPLEFINYIKNAEYVVSTSFHATVFSIIFNKKFFTVPHKQTGARVTNLLEKLEINGRVFESYDNFKNADFNIETDWKNVKKILDMEREKSLNWLKNAIEG